MGKHIASSRTPGDMIAPTAIKYTLSKKIAVAEDLAAGFSLDEVSMRHGIAKSTAHEIRHNQEIQDLISPEIVDRRRKSMAKIYEMQADVALSTLTPERWEKERPASVMTAAAIATDKSRLLRGESTENVSIRGTVETINSEIAELKKKREQMFSPRQQSDQSEESAKIDGNVSYPQEIGQNVKE